MKKLAVIIAALLGFPAAAAVATHTSTTEEHVVPGTTIVIPDRTITDEDPVPDPVTVTVTAASSTTAPTTTATTTAPAPSGQLIMPDNQPFICRGPVDYNYVRVNITSNWVNAFQIASGCSGRIGSIAVNTNQDDAIRITNGSSGDLLVNGGFVRCRGKAAGAHQDGMQTISGPDSDVTFRNVVFSGCDTQHIISSSVNNGRFLCDGCTFLAEHSGLAFPVHPQVDGGPANAAIMVYGNIGTLNTLICVGSRFNHGVRIDSNPNVIGWVDNTPGGYDAQPAPGSGNQVLPVSDPLCQGTG